ncbi:MAG: suppressor of glycerol defect [Caeruleum heppii]|nr:MAG: suppressor of glycerol defect [Caeruleum heppii]
MRRRNETTKLPSQIALELGRQEPAGTPSARGTTSRRSAGSRKERRKAERQEKKTQRRQPRPKSTLSRHDTEPESEEAFDAESTHALPPKPAPLPLDSKITVTLPKSILKKTAPPPEKATARQAKQNQSPSPSPLISKGVRDRLAKDDAEIAALEKKLGLKGKKSLPKSFEDEGLDYLLEGLDETEQEISGRGTKRKTTEEDEWLRNKRRKADGSRPIPEHDEDFEDDRSEEDEEASTDILGEDTEDTSVSDKEGTSDWSSGEDFNGFDADTRPPPSRKRKRENPYIAPPSDLPQPAAAKYIPPSLRTPSSSGDEALSRLRRQAQGLLNRLSEANLISILGEVEQLYRNHPRQHVTSVLVELLLGLISDRSNLMDTFLILHAGFIAALYKVIGTDFGASIVQSIIEHFDRHYQPKRGALNQELTAGPASGGKEATNLVSLLSELYNFQVVGSNLIFDLIRLFLGELSETNTELLLKIISNSGPQLRQDDPSAIKDIVLMLQSLMAGAGQATLSVRTKYMVETINDLKNNRMKTGAAALAVKSGAMIQMKKTIGSLSHRTVRASEPLRIGLQDIRESEKKGKWWLVGASWKAGEAAEEPQRTSAAKSGQEDNVEDDDFIDSGTADILQLARQQRMNTDIRRAIFVTIMSASDCRDAHSRLTKLRLKRSQELEIPRVLIQCAGAEQGYNPYYTVIARHLCSDNKIRKGFQFGLWDLFRRMGEGGDDNELSTPMDGDRDEEVLGMRATVNLAKMFGNLMAQGSLGLAVLKTLDFPYLQAKTRTFAELLLITVLLQCQERVEESKRVIAIRKLFGEVRGHVQLARGLQFFLRKVVSKTDVAGGKRETRMVRWGCQVAGEALQDAATLPDTVA